VSSRSTETVFAAAAAGCDGTGGSLGGERPVPNGTTVVVVGAGESELVARAVERGLEPLLVSDERLEDAIAMALEQAEELKRLRAVSARLAQVERAKGILMERHKVNERDAHDRLRRHARNLNVKLATVAQAVEDSYLLLPLEEP
jgi:AmiR/NasT family two-component response regulator